MNSSALGRRRPHWAAFVIAAGLAGLAVILWWDASQLSQDRGYAGIGPADIPRVVAMGLFALAIATIIAGWRDTLPRAPQQNFGPVLWILAGLCLQLLLLHTAGFAIATGLLFAFTARGFGQGPLWMNIGIGIAFALVVYVIFALALKLSLPSGPIEELIKSLATGNPPSAALPTAFAPHEV